MKGGFFTDLNELAPVTSPPLFTQTPTDYFDFWNSLSAFGRSLGSSELVEYQGAYFRQRNKILTLCSYSCPGEELRDILSKLQAKQYKIKTLNFVHKDFSKLDIKFYKHEFYIQGTQFTIEEALSKAKNSSKTNQKIRRGYRTVENLYVLDTSPPKDQCLHVFWKWVKYAKKRLFMVVTGHYLKYLELAYVPGTGIHILGFRRKDTGELCGIAGWEYSQNNNAQITLMKHLELENGFPKFFWIKTIDTIMRQRHNPGPSLVFCGTTADELKTRIGLDSWKSYKLVLRGGNSQ